MTSREHANKYLCNVCNIWIADNKPQREQHENGQKHKSAKVRLLKEIAKKNEASLRATGKTVLTNSAAQQMLECVARATNVADSRETGVLEIKEELDKDGFPLPADKVYGWVDVDEGGSAPGEYMTSDALGEFAPDAEEETYGREDSDERDRGQDGGKDEPKPVATVAENEDPEERKRVESAFKKRVAPKSRRKRRAR